jgi:ABC-type Na+ efflux pump permease subunit
VVAYLVRQEIKRNLRPARAVPLLVVAMVLAYREVRGPWQSDVAHVQGALTLRDFWLTMVIPLVAGATGSSMAQDRRSGVTLTFLSRGLSRGRYLASKLLGAAASGGLLTLLILTGFYIMVAILWPWSRATWEGNQWNPGPVPALYRQNPLASDLVVASMHLTAAAALPLVGVLAGMVVANEYIAMAAPLLFTILTTILFREIWEPLSPELYLSLAHGPLVSPSFQLWAPYLYWLGLSALITALCVWLFHKREPT